MACHLIGAKPSPEPILAYCQLDTWEQISVKFQSELDHSHSRKLIWKCLPEWRPFCPGGNELRPRQNGCNFTDNIFKCIFLNETFLILSKISLKFVPEGPIDNTPALVQIMDWCQAIIWSSDGIVNWCIYAPVGPNQLISSKIHPISHPCRRSMCCLSRVQIQVYLLSSWLHCGF